MTILELGKIKELFYAEILYEVHNTEAKLKYFEQKYKTGFKEFEKSVKDTNKEDFENWDDYMEWKGYYNSYSSLLSQKKDIENGNIKVAS